MRTRDFTIGQFIRSDDMPRHLRVTLFGEEVARALDGPQDGKGHDLPLRVLAVNRETGEITIGAKFRNEEVLEDDDNG